MKFKILSWNVRGANAPDKRKVIKNFLRSYRADLVRLQETKIQEMLIDLVRSLGVGHQLNWKAMNAEGSAGGILLFWDNIRINLVDSVVGSFSISCLFRMPEDGYQWAFTGVYGPVENSSSLGRAGFDQGSLGRPMVCWRRFQRGSFPR